MNTKEAIEFSESCKDVVTSMDIDDGQEEGIKKYNEEIDKVIALLKRGEKYRKIVYEINNERLFEEYDGVYGIPSNSPKNIHQKIKEIIQKYFPKPVKRTVRFDIELDNIDSQVDIVMGIREYVNNMNGVKVCSQISTKLLNYSNKNTSRKEVASVN